MSMFFGCGLGAAPKTLTSAVTMIGSPSLEKSAYEDSLLGTIILNGSMGVSASLSRSDFSSQINQEIFSALLSIHLRGDPIEMPSVLDELALTGNQTLIKIEYLLKLTDSPIVSEEAACRALRLNSARAELKRRLKEAVAEKDPIAAAQKAIQATEALEGHGTKSITANRAIELFELEEAINERGVPTGLAVDKHLHSGGIRHSRMLVLAARPKVGKTAVSMHIAAAAARDGAVVFFFSLELGQEELGGRLKAQNLTKEECERIHVYTDAHDISEIISELYQARATHRDDRILIVIDYSGLIDNKEMHLQIRSQQISHIVRALKRTAIRKHLSILLLSQLNRDSVKDKDVKPTVAHLRDSGSLEQDSDAVCLMRKDPDSGQVILELAVQRQGPSGFEFAIDMCEGVVAGSRLLTSSPD